MLGIVWLKMVNLALKPPLDESFYPHTLYKNRIKSINCQIIKEDTCYERMVKIVIDYKWD